MPAPAAYGPCSISAATVVSARMTQPIQMRRRVHRAALVPAAINDEEDHAADQQREPDEHADARDAEQHADGRAALRVGLGRAAAHARRARRGRRGTSRCRRPDASRPRSRATRRGRRRSPASGPRPRRCGRSSTECAVRAGRDPLPGAREDADRAERDLDVLVERQRQLRRRLRRDAVLGRIGSSSRWRGPTPGRRPRSGRSPRAPARRRAEPGALLSCARHNTTRAGLAPGAGPVRACSRRARARAVAWFACSAVSRSAGRRRRGGDRRRRAVRGARRRRTRSADPGRPTTAAGSWRSRRRRPA